MPHRIRCGSHDHSTVQEVRDCQSGRRPTFANTRSSVAAQAIDDQLAKMLLEVKDGRYAVRLDASHPFTFVRLSRPKNGKAAGFLKIQTQHSEAYQTVAMISTSLGGRRYLHNESILVPLRLLVCDPTTAAYDYGAEMERCCRCGKELTDERSRWYAIGPECEKFAPEIFAMVQDKKGIYVPSSATR